LLLGIFDTRTTKEGAIAGMLLGIGFTAAYIIWFRFVDPTATADQWLFGISPEGIGTIGMGLNFMVAIIVSRFTPPPPLDVQKMIEDIRSPSGNWDA
jgi:cation/acetate symporter